MLLFEVSIHSFYSENPENIYHGSHKNIKQKLFSILIIIENVSWAANQYDFGRLMIHSTIVLMKSLIKRKKVCFNHQPWNIKLPKN